MIIEIIAAGVAVTGFITAGVVKAIAVDAKQSEQKAIERKEQAEKKARRLLGVKIGVACFEPNGSVHDLEGEVMDCILKTSGRCAVTNRHLVREHVKGLDVWKDDGAGVLVDADLLIAGTVIEQNKTHDWVAESPSHTAEFLTWVMAHYPDNIINGSTVIHLYCEDAGTLAAKYHKQSGKLATECKKFTTTSLNLRVDFRCYSPHGEIVGAGVITKELTKTNMELRSSVIQSLAKEIVDRIHVSTSDGSLEVWYGDARAMAISRRMEEDQWKLIEGRKNGEG